MRLEKDESNLRQELEAKLVRVISEGFVPEGTPMHVMANALLGCATTMAAVYLEKKGVLSEDAASDWYTDTAAYLSQALKRRIAAAGGPVDTSDEEKRN